MIVPFSPSFAAKFLISLVTYNEAGNLKPLVDTGRPITPESLDLIIDNNSPAGSLMSPVSYL